MLDHFFKLKENGTTISTECLAGITTFLTMVYIIFVNPAILALSGMDKDAVFVATCLAAALGSAIMGIAANYPIALAPGMGLNAYFTFYVVKSLGLSWQTALGAVFLSGMLFILVSLSKIREKLVNAIPDSLKSAITAGIGLFLALIALKSAGIVTGSAETLLTLGNMRAPTTVLAIVGFIFIAVLEYRRIYGAILLSILGVTGISVMLGYVSYNGVFSFPPSIMPTFMQMDIRSAFNTGLIGIIFIFFFVDLFNTSGTLIGVAHHAGLLDKSGKLPRLKRALLADSIAITSGAILGTSSTTTYIESAAGVAAGGRTGLTAVVTALLFLIALWFSPLASMVPEYATAPVLFYVAILMTKSLAEINWRDLTESAPAIVTALSMPFTFSIADGIAFGFITYTVLKLLTGQSKHISAILIGISVLWLVKFTFF